MHPEDRLDALLSLHIGTDAEAEYQYAAVPPAGRLNGRADLQPLLDTSDRLGGLRGAEPSPDFAARLESLFLDTAASLRGREDAAPMFAQTDPSWLPVIDVPPLGNDKPTLPGTHWGDLDDEPTDTSITPRWRRPVALRSPVWRRLLWPAIAAALLLAIGTTTLTAAAAAGPGTPLYGLHRWEQGVQVSMAGSAAGRAKLHLGYAQDALAALDAAAAQHQTGPAYDDALATFRDEMQAASVNLDGVPAGGDHDALVAQLDQLQAQGRAGLRAALAALPWQKRVATTTVLAAIGDNVLSVAQANMVYSSHGQHLWQITVAGSGFQPGAVLLSNGQPAGTVISVTPTRLVAQIPGDDSAPLPGSIGVANPDNTAAVTAKVSGNEPDDATTPGAQQTPESQETPGTDDHGGDRTGGSGSSDGGTSGDWATPTATGESGH